MSVKPVFLFCLPRSGSTLLQRLLGAHPAIHTVAEPWVLLPLLYMRRADGIAAEYSHQAAYMAVHEFIAELPDGERDFDRAVERFVCDLYQRVSPEGSAYFLDKTPRYHLIANDIIRIFPDAKFVFLWRNPVSTLSSIMQTWGGSTKYFYRFRIDLLKGTRELVDAYGQHQGSACALCYEELVHDPEAALRRVFTYLELDFGPTILKQFADVRFAGRMGDQDGTKHYRHVSDEPLTKWKMHLANPVRLRLARRYVNWIGSSRLATMGYDRLALIQDLDSMPTRMTGLLSDLIYLFLGMFHTLFELRVLRFKLKRLRHWNNIYVQQ